MQGSKILLAIIVLVHRKNVGQHKTIECSGIKLISKFTVRHSNKYVGESSQVSSPAG
jgi:hypothetical protein